MPNDVRLSNGHTAVIYLGDGRVTGRITLPPGTSCWIRAYIEGGPNHGSGRNFDFEPDGQVHYTISGTTLNHPSFD